MTKQSSNYVLDYSEWSEEPDLECEGADAEFEKVVLAHAIDFVSKGEGEILIVLDSNIHED